MIFRKIFLVVAVASISSYFKFCDCKLAQKELDLVKRFGDYLNVQSFVFIDENNDTSWLKRIKYFLREGFETSVFTSKRFMSILKNNGLQRNYFNKKTIVATAEIMNLTEILDLAVVPHLLTWLIFNDYDLYGGNLYIPMSADVLFIHMTSGSVVTTQIYHIKRGFNETNKIIRNWIPNITNSPFILDWRKNNFNGVKLDMQVMLGSKFCQNAKGKTVIRKMECLQQSLLELIGRRLNFSLNTIESKDVNNTYALSNNTESELMMKLKDRTIDVSAALHLVNVNVIGGFDYIWPTFVSKTRMYLKQTKTAGHWDSYVRPLAGNVWGAIISWMIVTGIFIYICELLLLKKKSRKALIAFDCIDSVLTSFQVLSNQAHNNYPPFNAIRIIYFLQLFVVLIFYQSYCGYLVSSLTVAIPHYPFMDMKGFFDNDNYRIMTLKNGFNEQFFKKQVFKGKTNDFMLKDSLLPASAEEGAKKLCVQDYLAFVEFREDMLDLNKFNCKIIELPYALFTLFMGMALPASSPYTEIIKREMIHLTSTGIKHSMKKRLSPPSAFTTHKSAEEFQTVSLAQVFTVYILLGIGIILSIILFILELIKKKKRRLVYGHRKKDNRMHFKSTSPFYCF